MTQDKEYTKDDLNQKTEIALMQKDITFIKKTLEELPNTIIDGVMFQVEKIKNQAVEQYRKEAEAKYALKSEIKVLSDKDEFEKTVCDVIEKQVGKAFLAKVVGVSGLIFTIITIIVQAAIEKYK